MKVTKQQIIEAAKKSGFTDREYGLVAYDQKGFHGEIGVEEYPCGNNILKLLENLGIEVEE